MSECVIAGMGGGGKLKTLSGTVNVTDAPISVNLGGRPQLLFIEAGGTSFGAGNFEFCISKSSGYRASATITESGFTANTAWANLSYVAKYLAIM